MTYNFILFTFLGLLLVQTSKAQDDKNNQSTKKINTSSPYDSMIILSVTGMSESQKELEEKKAKFKSEKLELEEKKAKFKSEKLELEGEKAKFENIKVKKSLGVKKSIPKNSKTSKSIVINNVEDVIKSVSDVYGELNIAKDSIRTLNDSIRTLNDSIEVLKSKIDSLEGVILLKNKKIKKINRQLAETIPIKGETKGYPNMKEVTIPESISDPYKDGYVLDISINPRTFKGILEGDTNSVILAELHNFMFYDKNDNLVGKIDSVEIKDLNNNGGKRIRQVTTFIDLQKNLPISFYFQSDKNIRRCNCDKIFPIIKFYIFSKGKKTYLTEIKYMFIRPKNILK